jgi:16S rRNA (guanine527-N7)-methyltransferase
VAQDCHESRLAELEARLDLPAGSSKALAGLLEALAAESDPPTTIRDPARATDLHLADSLAGLAVTELRTADRLADVGSGAGFPGLPLAIALPRAHVDLVESARRKCVVIDRLIAATGLGNARSVRARAEEWATGEGREAYGAVTARAVAPLVVLAEYAAPLLRIGGVLVAWKGARDPDAERAAVLAATQLGLLQAEILPVTPFEGARNRHLHVYRKVAPTPERFPRRSGAAAKRPLA